MMRRALGRWGTRVTIGLLCAATLAPNPWLTAQAAADGRPPEALLRDFTTLLGKAPGTELQAALDTLSRGARRVSAETELAGDVIAFDGDLEIAGTVRGSAIALRGDVFVLPGANIGGDAIAVHGEVRLGGGTIAGDVRSMRRPPPDAAPVSAAQRTGTAVASTVGVLAIGAVLALLVLVVALGPFEGVVRTVEDDVGRAFWIGLATQLAAVPALVLASLALAITVVGLLVIPFALLAWVLAVAGLVTLGVLAVAAVIGRSRLKGDAARSRAGLLRALLIGYAVLGLPWMLAALLVSVPLAGVTARMLALGATWVAITVGMGAAVRSRVSRLNAPGSRVRAVSPAASSGRWQSRTAPAALPVEPEPLPDWQTPTPVMGVVAARRPASSEPSSLD